MRIPSQQRSVEHSDRNDECEASFNAALYQKVEDLEFFSTEVDAALAVL